MRRPSSKRRCTRASRRLGCRRKTSIASSIGALGWRVGAVQAIDRQPALRIDVRRDGRAGGLVAAKPVLGRVERFKADLRIAPDRIDGRFQSRRDAGLIGDRARRAAIERRARSSRRKTSSPRVDARVRQRFGRDRQRARGSDGGGRARETRRMRAPCRLQRSVAASSRGMMPAACGAREERVDGVACLPRPRSSLKAFTYRPMWARITSSLISKACSRTYGMTRLPSRAQRPGSRESRRRSRWRVGRRSRAHQDRPERDRQQRSVPPTTHRDPRSQIRPAVAIREARFVDDEPGVGLAVREHPTIVSKRICIATGSRPSASCRSRTRSSALAGDREARVRGSPGERRRAGARDEQRAAARPSAPPARSMR